MSKELKPVKGRREKWDDEIKHQIEYTDSELSLTSFWSGEDAMLQLTTDSSCYIQLNHTQVLELIRRLTDWSSQ